MRILWASTAPHGVSGYANQTRVTLPRLRALGHECVALAMHGLEGAGSSEWSGFRVLPRLPLAETAAHVRADVVVVLGDIWPLDPDRGGFDSFRWLHWTPVDSDRAPPAVADKAKRAHLAIAMSKHGRRCLERAGVRRLAYVPHAVDCAVFKPPEDKRAARERLGLPTDRFIVGIVAANEPRKALDEQVAAFAALRARRPDAFLCLHVPAFDPMGQAPPVAELCARHRLRAEDFALSDPLAMAMGLPDAYIADLYGSLDVLSNVTLGEGFGLPALEAQACGVPVVTGAWTACEELCGSGWLVAREDAQPVAHPLGGGARWFVPRPGAIAERLEQAYRGAGDELAARRARTFAEGYDADKVARECWAPLLAKLAGETTNVLAREGTDR